MSRDRRRQPLSRPEGSPKAHGSGSRRVAPGRVTTIRLIAADCHIRLPALNGAFTKLTPPPTLRAGYALTEITRIINNLSEPVEHWAAMVRDPVLCGLITLSTDVHSGRAVADPNQ